MKLSMFFSPRPKTEQNKLFFFFSMESVKVNTDMNVKTTNTVTIFDDVSGPKFGVGTKSQILHFSLPNFYDFGTNAVFKLLFGFGCFVGVGFFFPLYIYNLLQ